MIDYYEPKLDVTLSGCGFLGGYYAGALCLLQQIWPEKPYRRICGASCGGLIGALLLAGLSLELILDNAMEIIRQMHAFMRNPTLIRGVSIDVLLERKLESLLPKNAHELCTGRLGVSLTKLGSFENILVKQFATRQDLIDAVRAGCFIPLWSGTLKAPSYRDQQCIDGAYSDNCPRFREASQSDGVLENDSGHSIAMSPFAGELEVSPRDAKYWFKAKAFGNIYMANWNNLIRTLHAMLPFRTDRYRAYVIGGHRDMKEYLFLKQLIQCRDCWNERNRNNKRLTVIQREACLACLRLLEKVDSLKVPKSLLDVCRE